MARKPQDVTDAELAVLQVLWQRGSASIREITDELYPEGTTAQYATVQKLLERLEAKACAARDRDSVPHRFAATVDREHLIGLRLQDLADKLCEGSVAPLLTNLVNGGRLSRSDRQALRRLVDELDKERGGR